MTQLFENQEEFKKFLGELSEEDLRDFLEVQKETVGIIGSAVEAMREYKEFLKQKR